MLRAGTQAAAHIMRLAGARVARGVDVFVGSGNNGGDGYIVAAQLARLGVNVRVVAVKPPATPDALRAAELAKRWVPHVDELHGWQAVQSSPQQHANTTAHTHHADTNARSHHADTAAHDQQNTSVRGVIVDALLGTGAHGPLRNAVRDAAVSINAAGQHGSLVVALDLPTGVNATTGECAHGHVSANATIMFGTMRLGALSARHACGDISVVDIGLGEHGELPDGAAQFASRESLRAALPSIAWDAHKGTRGRTLVVGGTDGMAGAVQLACSGALASGAGLVRASVAPASVQPVQGLNPAVVCSAWPELAHRSNTGTKLAFDEALDEPLNGPAVNELATSRQRLTDAEHLGESGSLQHDVRSWAHVVVVGPGLGRDQNAALLLHHVLECAAHSDAALVLDADALTVLARYGMVSALQQCAGQREVVITPHLGEFRTLAAALNIPEPDGSTHDRMRAARAMAGALQCTVLLKGTPNICTGSSGDAWLISRGSNALATGGTGDVLSGVVAALLASARATGGDGARDKSGNSAALVAVAAWVHGVAGEMLSARGNTVADVVRALPAAWSAFTAAQPLPPGVLAQLPSVSEEEPCNTATLPSTPAQRFTSPAQLPSTPAHDVR